MTPGVKSLAGAVLTLTVALLLVPAAARADQYVVDFCTNFDTGAPAVAFGTLTGQTTVTCGSQNGAVLHQQPTLAANETEVISLLVPADRPNVAVERIQTRFGSPGTNPGPAGFSFLGLATEAATLATYDASGGPVTAAPDLGVPAPGRNIVWTLYCTTLETCTYANAFVIRVSSARLYLNEHVAPTLSVTGGTLTATGPKSGRMTFGFDAADTDSGVSAVAVTLDGVEVGAAKYACAFDDWSACPREQRAQLLPVDTTKVPDGSHELVATVRDAANNVLTRSLGTVTVANGPGPPTPNGAGASKGAKLTVSYTTTSKRSRTLSLNGSPAAAGTLVDEAGKPITGATIAVLARLRQAGARDAQIATATTAADGRFSLKLPSGPSRTITFAYTAFSNDTAPATTATLRTSVRAIVSARIRPRSVRPGGRITLSGRLGLLPSKGVEIGIQARQGKVWRLIDQVRTRSGGTFTWHYRFASRQSRKIYAFRARVASSNYPFATGNSKPVTVRVR